MARSPKAPGDLRISICHIPPQAANRRTPAWPRAATLAAFLAAFACPAAPPEPLEVAADSSLKHVLSELSASYADQPGALDVQLNLAPSGIIREQIERGGGQPIDVFVAASPTEVEKLSLAKLVLDDTVRTLAENEIVLVASWAQGDAALPWDFLARHTWERIAVANPEKAMSGVAARRLFEALGMLEDIHSKLYYENDSNRVLDQVKRAQVGAGIIYRSDVIQLKPRETFRVFELPSTNQPPILYCAVVMRSARTPEAARAYVDFLHATDSQPIWGKWGFSPVDQPGESGAEAPVPAGPDRPDAMSAPPVPAGDGAATPAPPVGLRHEKPQ